jgi:hypothetical protein
VTATSLGAVTFVCPDQLDDIPQVLLAFVGGQAQVFSERVSVTRMLHQALGVFWLRQPTVPLTGRIERHVRAVIALPEARVTDKMHIGVIAQQFDQLASQRHCAACAAIRTAAHDDVHAPKRNAVVDKKPSFAIAGCDIIGSAQWQGRFDFAHGELRTPGAAL